MLTSVSAVAAAELMLDIRSTFVEWRLPLLLPRLLLAFAALPAPSAAAAAAASAARGGVLVPAVSEMFPPPLGCCLSAACSAEIRRSSLLALRSSNARWLRIPFTCKEEDRSCEVEQYMRV
jgi:hypothetical protein